MKCRHCNNELKHRFVDLGNAPPSNAYLSESRIRAPETYYPLKVLVCDNCWLVQTEDYANADELFTKDYAYFSSTSKSWLDHAENYVSKITDYLSLNSNSLVIEVASNDGYLLRNFVSKGVPCLGVEPTDSTADAAEALGIPVLREFFGVKTATDIVASGKSADLICGNNVYAHVPDINDFTNGLRIALKPSGVINLEFPHLLKLIQKNQFDTIYHEHFSYLSLTAVNRIFSECGLRIYNVEHLPTHGGSLRIYGCHSHSGYIQDQSVISTLEAEKAFGLSNISVYEGFQEKANKVKNDILGFLLEQKRLGKSVAAYGAAAKGNTLLNYAGVRNDLIQYVCDAAVSKQNKYMPGSHIPIVRPEQLNITRPDWVVILPWNIAEEVIRQENQVTSWGGKFVVAVPELTIFQ